MRGSVRESLALGRQVLSHRRVRIVHRWRIVRTQVRTSDSQMVHGRTHVLRRFLLRLHPRTLHIVELRHTLELWRELPWRHLLGLRLAHPHLLRQRRRGSRPSWSCLANGERPIGDELIWWLGPHHIRCRRSRMRVRWTRSITIGSGEWWLSGHHVGRRWEHSRTRIYWSLWSGCRRWHCVRRRVRCIGRRFRDDLESAMRILQRPLWSRRVRDHGRRHSNDCSWIGLIPAITGPQLLNGHGNSGRKLIYDATQGIFSRRSCCRSRTLPNSLKSISTGLGIQWRNREPQWRLLPCCGGGCKRRCQKSRTGL